MIWLVPVLPAAAGGAIWLAGGRARRAGLAMAAAAAILASLAIAEWAVRTGAHGAFGWGAGLELTLAANGLSRVMAILVPVIALPVVAYAAYHEDEHGLARLVGQLTAFVGAMELLVLAGDLLTLLIGWEFVGLLSWALIGFDWRERAHMESAGQAFVPTRFGDLGLFLAAGAAFAGTGSMRFDALSRLSGANLDVVAAGVLVAAAAKSGQLPFSPWLFSAMAGPTPVSALLHSATMIAAGAYALARLQPALSHAPWFGPTVIGIGLATALAGGAVALVQNHGKRVLAASTSAQYGLMLVAIGAGYPGAAGAHLVTQAFFKALLFLAVGVAMQAAGTGDIRRMRLGRALPATAALALAGSLALAAVPPLGAAWSKEAIAAAAGQDHLVLALAVLFAGLLSAAYATRLQLLAFGRGGPAHAPGPTRVELGALGMLALGTVALGVLWLPGGAERVARWTGGAVPKESLALAATGIVAVVAGALAGAALARRDFAVPDVLADWLGIPVATKRLLVDPSLAAGRALAAFDDRFIDGMVRAAGWLGKRFGSQLARRDRVTVDAAVEAIGRAGIGVAAGSSRADDHIVDRAVDRIATAVGAAGRLARRAQSGMVHRYMLVASVGIAVAALLARAWR